MKKTWILVANKSKVNLFECDERKKIGLIKVFNNPEGSLKEGDLNSDRPGRFLNQSFVREKASVENSLLKFTRAIVSYLENGRNDKHFSDLILISGPQLSGLIKSQLNKNLKRSLKQNIIKELSTSDCKKLSSLF